MKKANAHEAVIAEWSRWALRHLKGKQSGNAKDAERFLAHLHENHPTFLMFRSQEGPEQTVRDGLREGGLVGK
jgi:hypothetical protein